MVSSVQCARQRGMTLLELLVAMTILAMVGALLMQGFGTALGTYERVQRRQSEGMPYELGYRWCSETLSGSQAELDEPRQFRGDAQHLGGVTHRPLLGGGGQASFFSWRLQHAENGELQLSYQQPGVDWLVASWPPGSAARFIYRAANGAAVEQWPPPQGGGGATPGSGQIPGAILLEVTPVESPPVRWYASLPGRTFPRPDYRDF